MDSTSLLSGSLLVHQYEIVREIGRGGMATVYLANDRKHGRTVAIKVLLPELCQAIGADRFTREIRTVSRLHHPHILPLYDSGEENGVLFFVMPFIEGESLRELLDREGSTDLALAATIVRQVGNALDFAHGHGVVHRDVKPENIMLVAGHAMLSDFGIARALSPDQLETLTGAGATLGTPFYMSPEQASGERNIDGRSDLYALGCITYEMLSGSRPFEGLNPMATIAQHITKSPPRLVGMREPVEHAVAEAVDCMLSKDPDDRFSSAASFAAVLELAVNTRTVGAKTVEHINAAPRESHTRVLVFDFINISAAADIDWLTVGIADTISGDLRRLDGVRVVGSDAQTRQRMSAALHGAVVDAVVAQRLGKSVGARWVVAGGFQRAGSRLRLTPQFFNVDSGEAVAAEKIDGSLDDIFDLQDKVVTQFANQLNVHLTANTSASGGTSPSARMQAYELYARGRQASLGFGAESTRVAEDYYRRAVAIDSHYALAWAGLGSLLMPRFLSTGSSTGLDESVLALQRALELDPALSEPYVYLAYWYIAQLRFDEAIEHARSAVEQDAGVPLAWYLLSISHFSRATEKKSLEDMALAIPPGLRARSIEPGFQAATLMLAAMYRLRGEYTFATQFANEAVDLELAGQGMKFVGSFVMRAFIHLNKDERDHARELFDFAVERYMNVDHFYAQTVTAWALFGSGRLAEREGDSARAREAYDRSRKLADENSHRSAIGSSWVKSTLGLARLAHVNDTSSGARQLFDDAISMILTRSRFVWINYPGASLADNWYEVAATHAHCGDRDGALQALRKAAEHGWADEEQLRADHLFGSLHSDGNLQQLVQNARAAVTLPTPTYSVRTLK